jgi:peptide/nickel transport system substrate-binding protein
MVKRILALALIGAIMAVSAAAQKGPIVDKILFETKMQQEIGMKDVAEGKSDVFFFGVDGNKFKALPDDVKAKLDVYSIPSGSWSLLMNPYPNKAPYTVQKDGKTLFNPFAIKDVRYAMNWLINRKQIVDEILAGAGIPSFSTVTPGQPNSARYGLVASKLGMTVTGNEKKAIAMIDAAMNEAAKLSELAGKLAKGDKYWMYDGQPIELNFLIRIEDGRLPEGRYVAAQWEKAGFKVNKLEYDRAKCSSIYRQQNPADFNWSLYTEGWGAGQTYAFWEGNLAQMYAPWYANMPGANKAGYWSYENARADELTQDTVNGKFADEKEYWAKNLEALEIGLKEAVRVYVCAQQQYYVANKDRFLNRMVYGLGDGLNKWSLNTADVKPTGNEKVLKMSNFSAQGALFMSAWDPIGADGYTDTYSVRIAKPMTDFSGDYNPVTAIPFPLTMTWGKPKTEIEKDAKGNIVGKIKVPADAVIWNARTKKWESGVVYADKGDGSYDYAKQDAITAYSINTYTLKPGKFHHGRALTIADYAYTQATGYEISLKKGADDKWFEPGYAEQKNPQLVVTKGWVISKDGKTVTSYFDFNYPIDQETVSLQGGAPSLLLKPSNNGVAVAWEIAEALMLMVAEGGKSGTAWSIIRDDKTTEVDVLNPKCVADIKAKLQDMVAKKHVPASITQWVKADDAVKFYQLAIAFIDKYGHAHISNGPFMMEKYDPANNSAILTAFRDKDYPYEKDYFTKLFATNFARIDSLKVGAYEKGKDVKVSAQISKVAFPNNTAVAADKANVKVTLAADKETVYTAKMTKAGLFEVSLPAADLAKLKAGSYTVIVEAALGTETATVDTEPLVVF